ncbi:MAG: hypothetical protein U9R15_00330, partial [Chloroflexota bacterium]|nr:hypothetical protein [Chloroflexota bacterium]
VESQEIVALMDELSPGNRRMALTYVMSLTERTTTVDARQSRRIVSAWLVRDVGHLLMGGEPHYIVDDGRPVWRVPVLVTYGRRGTVAFVDVDASTGDILVDDYTPAEIIAKVQTFAGNIASS